VARLVDYKKEDKNMTYQTNNLRLPILSFFGVPLSVMSLPNRGMKKRNEANQQAQPVVLYFDPESRFTKRSQNITSMPSVSSVAKKSKQTQISLILSDNQAFIKKQTQINPIIFSKNLRNLCHLWFRFVQNKANLNIFLIFREAEVMKQSQMFFNTIALSFFSFSC
jgi:hypothetical protein